MGSTAGQAVADLLADAEGYRERIGKLVCEIDAQLRPQR